MPAFLKAMANELCAALVSLGSVLVLLKQSGAAACPSFCLVSMALATLANLGVQMVQKKNVNKEKALRVKTRDATEVDIAAAAAKVAADCTADAAEKLRRKTLQGLNDCSLAQRGWTRRARQKALINCEGAWKKADSASKKAAIARNERNEIALELEEARKAIVSANSCKKMVP